MYLSLSKELPRPKSEMSEAVERVLKRLPRGMRKSISNLAPGSFRAGSGTYQAPKELVEKPGSLIDKSWELAASRFDVIDLVWA